jgi:hypothetical protein
MEVSTLQGVFSGESVLFIITTSVTETFVLLFPANQLTVTPTLRKRNVWNFSPKHFFSDSSGAYWRERRLRPGMYTDGVNVYEASYRYRDGRNGMHRVSTLQQFLRSTSVDAQQKSRILKRLQEAEPDVVLEL